MSSPILTVFGVTGHVGGRAAQQLLDAGQKIRAVVRDVNARRALEFKAQGAELFEVRAIDSNDPYATNEAQLVTALTGADAAFIVNPSHLTIEDPNKSSAEYVDTLARAVVASKIPRIVFLSSFTAWLKAGVGAKLLYLETVFNRIAQEHGVQITYLRPGFFFPNILGALSTVPEGFFVGHISDADKKVPFTSPDDIGDQAAKEMLICEKQTSNPKIVQIGGPEDVSFREIVKILSDITGNEIKYVPVPIEGRQASFEARGMSPEGARQFTEMYNGLEDGTATYQFKDSSHPIVRGKHHLKDFLADTLKK